MDGRTQIPVYKYIMKNFRPKFIDTITQAGPTKVLADPDKYPEAMNDIRRHMEISHKNHGSRFVAICAHHDCAGNPKTDAEQIKELEAAVRTLQTLGFGRALGLWVDENWQVQTVHEAKKAEAKKSKPTFTEAVVRVLPLFLREKLKEIVDYLTPPEGEKEQDLYEQLMDEIGVELNAAAAFFDKATSGDESALTDEFWKKHEVHWRELQRKIDIVNNISGHDFHGRYGALYENAKQSKLSLNQKPSLITEAIKDF